MNANFMAIGPVLLGLSDQTIRPNLLYPMANGTVWAGCGHVLGRALCELPYVAARAFLISSVL